MKLITAMYEEKPRADLIKSPQHLANRRIASAGTVSGKC